MDSRNLRVICCTALALMTLTATSEARTLSPVTGYGKIQFGVTRSAVECAFPNCRWECREPEGGGQVCVSQEPGITDMDQLALVYVDGLVGKIVMTTVTVKSNVELLTAWDKYKGIFTGKYGPPTSITETMTAPYDDNRAEFIRYGTSAISVGKCLYAAVWEDGTQENAPGITLVMKEGWLMIAYESTSFQDYSDRKSKKAAEEF